MQVENSLNTWLLKPSDIFPYGLFIWGLSECTVWTENVAGHAMKGYDDRDNILCLIPQINSIRTWPWKCKMWRARRWPCEVTSPAGNRILCCKYGVHSMRRSWLSPSTALCSFRAASVCRNWNVWVGKMHKPGDNLNNFLSCCTHWPVVEDACWEIVSAGAMDWQVPVSYVVRGQDWDWTVTLLCGLCQGLMLSLASMCTAVPVTSRRTNAYSVD